MASTGPSRIVGIDPFVAFKAPVQAATTEQVALKGLQVIDGVTLVEGDRVLVKDQDDPAENGIYTTKETAWERAKDFNGPRDITKGTLVSVASGERNADNVWKVSSDDPSPGRPVAFDLVGADIFEATREAVESADIAADAAASSSNAASKAEGDANSAEAAANRAESDANRAEAARDAAQLSAGVFDSTAAGLAATTVGDYFNVPSAEVDEYLILYRHAAGPTAAEVKRYPSAGMVTEAIAPWRAPIGLSPLGKTIPSLMTILLFRTI